MQSKHYQPVIENVRVRSTRDTERETGEAGHDSGYGRGAGERNGCATMQVRRGRSGQEVVNVMLTVRLLPLSDNTAWPGTGRRIGGRFIRAAQVGGLRLRVSATSASAATPPVVLDHRLILTIRASSRVKANLRLTSNSGDRERMLSIISDSGAHGRKRRA